MNFALSNCLRLPLMPIVSVTRLRVRRWWYLPAFLVSAIRSSRQAKAAEGNLGVKLLADRRKAFWTCTAWDTESAMKQFMLAPPHGPAMRKLLTWCDEAALVHWTQPDPEMPSWLEAHRRLQSEGRRSKVLFPSPAHQSFTVDGPRQKRKSEAASK